jgi:cellulase/cellobiase CelA1
MDPNKSTRERYEVHSVEPACAGCHDLIDPLGFGLEHYDGIGRWRDLDGPHEIDASGVITGLANGDVSFNGAQDMSEKLAEQQEVSQCYMQQWYTYGFGEGDRENSSISCGIEEAFEYYMNLGENLQSPIIALTQVDRFFEREGDSAGGDSLAIDSHYIETNPPDINEPGGDNPDLEVYVIEDANWGSGYCNTVSITNLSTADITWEITLEVSGNISSLWSAQEISNDGNNIVFAGVSWNETLVSGASTSFGFCAEM